MIKSTSTILLSFLSLISLLPASISATCYWQNSTLAPNDQYSIATDDVACFPSQQNSPCCGTGWSCLSDGVCYIRQGSNEFYYRGTCTDKTWNSQQCPGWCFAQNNSTSIPLQKCKKSTGEDWYCCPGDPDCDCTSGKDAIKLGASAPVTVTVIGSTSWPGYTSTTTPVTAGNIAQSTGSTTTTSPAAASTTANAPSPNASPPSSNSSTTALAAGLGAGVGAVVVILAIAAFWMFQRSKKRRAAAAAAPANGHFINHYGAPSAGNATPFNAGMHSLPVTPRPGEGYYATQVVNEKDGAQAYGTQELPGYDNTNSHNHGNAYGYYAKGSQRSEMDASSQYGSEVSRSYSHAHARGSPGRVELA